MNNSLVCLNYNDVKTVISFIDKIINYKSIDSIIIVDNCSTDDSYIILREKFSSEAKIDIIRTDKNGGYSYGNNFGIRYAKEKYDPKVIIISNPDVIFDEILIKRGCEFIENNIDVAIISYVMRNKDFTINSGAYWDTPIKPIKECFNYIFPRQKEINMPPNTIFEVGAVPGSFFLVRFNALEAVDLLDENVFLYYEENILSYKLNKLGYKSYLDSNYSYIHNHSVTINKHYSEYSKFKILMKSSEYYWKKIVGVKKVTLIMIYFLHSIAKMEKKILYFIRHLKSVKRHN